MEQTEGRGVPVPLYAPLWAIALALLFQGTTSAAALSRASRGEVPGEVRDRWSRLRALAVALRAERQAIAEIARQGSLDDDALNSMEDAVAGGERRVEAALSEVHGAEPALRSEELSAAVRAVLAAGREAVAEARERGWIAAGPAAEVERELARRWSRSGTASLHELLSGLDAPPSRDPVRDTASRPSPAPRSPARGPEGGGQVHGPG
jgi:hypothetical protein